MSRLLADLLGCKRTAVITSATSAPTTSSAGSRAEGASSAIAASVAASSFVTPPGASAWIHNKAYNLDRHHIDGLHERNLDHH